MRHSLSITSIAGLLAAALLLSACEGGKLRKVRQRTATEIGKQYEDNPAEKITGEGLLGGSSGKDTGAGAGGAGGIGVNSFLWRATLDTIAFMPVSSADPFGGVIITDWYAPPETPNERFKLNIYVLGRALRADGLRVSVFRQAIDTQGSWRDAAVEDDAGRKIEDSILTRARQLRNETRAQN